MQKKTSRKKIKKQENIERQKTKKYIPKKQTNCIFILSLSGFFSIFFALENCAHFL